MAHEQIKLLRRPLPPRNLQPLLKPSLKSVLPGPGTEYIPSGVHKTSKECERSCCGDISQRDFDQEASHVAPTPLSCRSPVSPATPPNSFFYRPRRTFPQTHTVDLLRDNPRYSHPPPSFLLNEFLESVQLVRVLGPPGQVIRSHHTYRKLVDLLLLELHSGRQREVSRQILSCEGFPQAECRIPPIICELAALVQMELQARSMCRTDHAVSQVEQSSVQPWAPPEAWAELRQHIMHPVKDIIVSSSPVKHFQGSCRSSSPFQPAAECMTIPLTELAVLDCIAQCDTALNLKAHFVTQLPDLSALAHTLLYLNLSFNSFSEFPVKVCDLARLEVLKMRDNPIEEIPIEIEKMPNLKTLVISFCKLTTLPSQLYHLPSLQHLDVSHNLISSLCSEIRNLRSLQYLNVEGNRLEALPVGIQNLSLSELRLAGNYTHPLLWSINGVNSPPTLTHTATHTLALLNSEKHYCDLPPEAQDALSRAGVCECCGGPRFGPGLKLIRPVHHLFGLVNVPIFYLSCSPSCYSRFRKQTHNLTDTTHRTDGNRFLVLQTF